MIDLNIDTFIVILEKIEDNDRNFKFTHKEIRLYVNVIHDLYEKLEVKIQTQENTVIQEIKFLLAALLTHTSHKKRAFFAHRLLKLLRQIRFEESTDESYHESF